MTELDKESNGLLFCSKNLTNYYKQILIDNQMSIKCQKICPKDCVFNDFKVTKKLVNYDKPNTDEGTRLFWDTTSPIVYYIETPVLTFIEYLCYCGGLFGLWFATNGKLFENLMSNALRNKFQSYHNSFNNMKLTYFQ